MAGVELTSGGRHDVWSDNCNWYIVGRILTFATETFTDCTEAIQIIRPGETKLPCLPEIRGATSRELRNFVQDDAILLKRALNYIKLDRY